MLLDMIRIYVRLPRPMQIACIPLIFIGLINNRDGYRKNNKIQHSALTVYDLSDCPAAPPAFLPLTDTKSALFNKPSCTLHFTAPNHFDKLNVDVLRSRIKEVLQKNPELESELTPFLDCNQITLEPDSSWFRSGKTHHTVALRTKKSGLATKDPNDDRVPLIVVGANEFIFIRSPRDDSPAAMREYRALKRIYSFPKEVRDLILLNKKLMKLFEDKKIKINGLVNGLGTSYEIHVTKAGQTFVHSFQKTFLGYWRYAGEAEKNSARFISQKVFGRSLIF